MRNYIDLIKTIVPEFEPVQTKETFSDIGVDSIDLVAVRVEFERSLGTTISDKDWTSFRSFSDIIEYADSPGEKTVANASDLREINETLRINMPQMALESLSENWLFKSIGNKHWTLLCEGLGVESDKIEDEMGNRLYATFVRIKYECNNSLAHFVENEEITLNSQIERYGKGLYFSSVTFNSTRNKLNAELMTSFARRGGGGNKDLVKSQPFTQNNTVRESGEMPAFGNEYRLLKRKELKAFELDGFQFTMGEEVLFETEYTLNPYYDLNGVGLLYFAAYPIINDFCEAEYANVELFNAGNDRWEENYFTKARDILYFSNCDIHEIVVYKLHFVAQDGDLIRTHSSLYRKSDDKKMAEVFTVKAKK